MSADTDHYRQAFAEAWGRRGQTRQRAVAPALIPLAEPSAFEPGPAGMNVLERVFGAPQTIPGPGEIVGRPVVADLPLEREQAAERVRSGFEQAQPDPNGKTAIINLRLPAEDKQMIEAAAQLSELTISELVRRAAIHEAHAILTEYEGGS